MSASNHPASINDLSVELLVGMVFKQVIESEREGPGGRPSLKWMRLLHVCRRWRKLVEGQRAWWSDIDVIHPDATRFMLRFMRKDKISPRFRLRLESGEPKEKVTELLNVVRESAPDLVSLRLDLSAEAWISVFANDTVWAFDKLESLVLRSEGPLAYSYSNPNRLPFAVPALKSLQTSEIHLAVLQPIIPACLEDLRVYGTVDVKASVVRRALDTVKSLRRLELAVDVVDDGTWWLMDHAERRIKFPELERLYLLVRDAGVLKLFSRLEDCHRASTILDLQCSSLNNALGFLRMAAWKIRQMAEDNCYRHCELYHANVQYTRIVLASGGELKYMEPRLEVVFEGYPEDTEEQLYKTIRGVLRPALLRVKHLRIRDMEAYDGEGSPSCRDLIGTFPTTLIKHSKTSGGMPFPELETLDVENVRFRQTFRKNSNHDFLWGLVKFIQSLLPEKHPKKLTIYNAVNLCDYDVERLRDILANEEVVWDESVQEEDGGSGGGSE